MKITYDQELVRESHKYSLPQLYEAFINEHNARKNLEKSLSRAELHRAGLKSQYDALMSKLQETEEVLEIYEEEYLKLHIYKNIEIVVPPGTPPDEAQKLKEETIDYFFSKPRRKVFYTPNGGYIGIFEEQYLDGSPWYNMIEFMYSNPDKLRQEMTDHLKLIKDIYDNSTIPLLYTGIHNVARNHCVTIADGIWMLRLDDKFDGYIEGFKEVFKQNQSDDT